MERRYVLNSAAVNLLNIILPPLCLGCKLEGFYICPKCVHEIQQFNYFICPVCKRRDPEGILDPACKRVSGLTRFLGAPLPYCIAITKKIVHSLKYSYAKELALPLSQILIEFLRKNNLRELIYKRVPRLIVTPVPLHKFRERERGFNQSEELAKNISAYYNIPLTSEILFKTKNTEPQAEIDDYAKRQVNISGAFKCKNAEKFLNKIVILIDDVYTSGSTMRECALTLRKSGAKEVWGITVARS